MIRVLNSCSPSVDVAGLKRSGFVISKTKQFDSWPYGWFVYAEVQLLGLIAQIEPPA